MIAIENLVARFDRIGRERLQGLPVYNAKLRVEALDFQQCQHGLLGALVTPWFINIILLPAEPSAWLHHELGSKHSFALASGEQQFVLGEDEEVGRYFFRSVVSPPHCYQQQAEARSAAHAALHKLLTPEAETAPATTGSTQVELDPRLQKPTGRREFMRNVLSAGVKTTVS